MTSETSGTSAASGGPDAGAARPLDRSYRALVDVPGLGRIVLVLFVLGEYGPPILAGAVTFAQCVGVRRRGLLAALLVPREEAAPA